MLTMQEMAKGRTLAEEQGMTAEMGEAVVRMAGAELEAGRLDAARAILEGLAVTNPHDPAAWAMLSQVLRRQGKGIGARVCAEAAARLAPGEEQVRLLRAEAMLGNPEEASEARAEIAALAAARDRVGERARALLGALGP
jgi:predicted Zn-dependent protease